MNASTFNWPLLQFIVDCFVILLILFLLFVLFREHKQRLLLKKWILRQLRLNQNPSQHGGSETKRPFSSAEEAIKSLQEEIRNAQVLLDTLAARSEEKEEPPPEPVSKEPSTSVQPIPPSPPKAPSQEVPNAVQEAIRYLLKKGMRPLEISRQLQIPIEEVERAYAAGTLDRKKEGIP